MCVCEVWQGVIASLLVHPSLHNLSLPLISSPPHFLLRVRTRVCDRVNKMSRTCSILCSNFNTEMKESRSELQVYVFRLRKDGC